MIALFIALTLCFTLLCIAYSAFRNPIKAARREIMLGCSLAACATLITGMALYPMTQVWQAKRAADVQFERLNAEAARTKIMIEQLGSAGAYVEYLKAIQEK